MVMNWFTEDNIFEVIAEEQNQNESEEIEFDDSSVVEYDFDYTVQN